MSRNVLRGLSLLLALTMGAVLGYGYMCIVYLQALARVRSFRPGAMLCTYDYIEATILAVTIAAATAVLLTGAFWHCYDRLPEVRSRPDSSS